LKPEARLLFVERRAGLKTQNSERGIETSQRPNGNGGIRSLKTQNSERGIETIVKAAIRKERG